MESIQIDGDVFAFLRSRVRNFNETPNCVLRRELGLDTAGGKAASASPQSLTSNKAFTRTTIPASAPAALAQIVEVVSLVRVDGLDRVSATLRVAESRGVARETVGDKYGRQLGLTTKEFDRLLTEKNLDGLSKILSRKFPRYEASVKSAFVSISALSNS